MAQDTWNPSNGLERSRSLDSMSSASSDDEEKEMKCKECGCLKTVSNAIIHGMEKAFYVIGRGIALYPWVTILCCIILTAAFIPGLALFFYQEGNPEKLWVPLGSQSVVDKEFVDEHFPSMYRFQSVIIEYDNVLTPQVINGMLDLDIEVKGIVSEPSGITWEQFCGRLGAECWSNSLLELWSFDETVIRSLTLADIRTAVNTITVSPVFGTDYNVTQVLGEVVYDDATGDIIGASATNMQWVILPNGTLEDKFSETLEDVLDWEEKFLDVISQQSQIFEIYYYSGRSFLDEGGGAIGGDVLYLSIGYILVIIFVAVVLGRFTRIRHRIYVSFAGIISIGLAIICSFGLCSYAGLFFGPVHSILPFLLLGIGVDDMFVICQSLDTLGKDKDSLPVHERIGLALKDAGVSITVTSLTDILAFAVGASTTLPALRSFCAYAAVGVFFTFLFQATFLVACLAYDILRIDQERNACCCCIIHRDDVPNECSNTLVMQTVFDKFYAPLMIKLPTKIISLLIGAALLGLGIWGVVNLEQDFDIAWFLPPDTYARKYIDASEKYFPSSGDIGGVYFGNVNYFEDYDKLEDMYFDVKNDQYIANVDCWYYEFRQWMFNTSNPLLGPDDFPTTEDDFYTLLGMYLGSPEGARFIPSFDFVESTPLRAEASKMDFKHVNLVGAAVEINAMDSIRAIVASYNYPPEECFAYALAYLNSETNKVIKFELYRNLGLAFLCVFVMTLVLLADIPACLLVCLCVIMSLVDVGGFMHFWGLTIDTVTSINLIVAIGLTVDYSAHIAHTFLTINGSRNKRVKKTLSLIGPPVFFGGFSTFLAFIAVAASTSYVFSTFFKVFLLVVLFGLFHGLVFLPVILSWIGPNSYGIQPSEQETDTKGATEMYDNYGFQNGGKNGTIPSEMKHTPGDQGDPVFVYEKNWDAKPEANGHSHTASNGNLHRDEKTNGTITPVEA